MNHVKIVFRRDIVRLNTGVRHPPSRIEPPNDPLQAKIIRADGGEEVGFLGEHTPGGVGNLRRGFLMLQPSRRYQALALGFGYGVAEFSRRVYPKFHCLIDALQSIYLPVPVRHAAGKLLYLGHESAVRVASRENDLVLEHRSSSGGDRPRLLRIAYGYAVRSSC